MKPLPTAKESNSQAEERERDAKRWKWVFIGAVCLAVCIVVWNKANNNSPYVLERKTPISEYSASNNNSKASNNNSSNATDTRTTPSVSKPRESVSYDVPDFYALGGTNLTFTGKEVWKGGRTYGFDCDVNTKENYIAQFIAALTRNKLFEQIDHDYQDYIATSASTFETWYFVYKGNKNVSLFKSFNPKNIHQQHQNHLNVGVSHDFQRGIKHFSLRIADNLTYEGEHIVKEYENRGGNRQTSAPPVSAGNSSREQPTYPELLKSCPACDGYGRIDCTSCNGKGGREVRKSTPNYSGSTKGPTYYTTMEPCSICGGSGKKICTRCGGSGTIR